MNSFFTTIGCTCFTTSSTSTWSAFCFSFLCSWLFSCGWIQKIWTHICMKYRFIGMSERPEPWEPYDAAKRAVLYRSNWLYLLEEFMLGPWPVLSSRRRFKFIAIFLLIWTQFFEMPFADLDAVTRCFHWGSHGGRLVSNLHTVAVEWNFVSHAGTVRWDPRLPPLA